MSEVDISGTLHSHASAASSTPRPDRLQLFWMRPRSFPGNFGDELSAPLIEANTPWRVEWASLSRCTHLGAGSILQFPWTRGTIAENPAMHVLGSGLMTPELVASPVQQINLVAVRGRLTQSVLQSQGHPVSGNVGDLGILASTLLSGNRDKTHEFGIIPHHSRFERYLPLFSGNPEARLIDVRSKDCVDVLNQISECRIIISESLHGLIAADSLHVPNVWLRTPPFHTGGHFKFLDYFSSLGRNPERFVGLEQINSRRALMDAAHSDWSAVDQLKTHVMQWLRSHVASLR